MLLVDIQKRWAKRPTNDRVSVLGHYPEYVEISDKLNANRFEIPTEIWKKMSPAERWAANKKFLDRMILRGDKIRLATPLIKVKPGIVFLKRN